MTPPGQSLLLCSVLAALILRPESGAAYLPVEYPYPIDLRQRRAVPTCDEGSYFDSTSSSCQQCTLCPKGYTSDHDCEDGVGPGTCQRCGRGYYQDEDDSAGFCQHCLTCYKRETLRRCTRESGTECGGCIDGYYESHSGVCANCKTLKNRNRQEACRDRPKTTVAPVVIAPSTAVSGIVSTTPAPDPTTLTTPVASSSSAATTEAPFLTTEVTGEELLTTPITEPDDDGRLSYYFPPTDTSTPDQAQHILDSDVSREEERNSWKGLFVVLSYLVGIALVITTVFYLLLLAKKHVPNLPKPPAREILRRVGETYQLKPLRTGGKAVDVETGTIDKGRETDSFIQTISEERGVLDGDGTSIQGGSVEGAACGGIPVGGGNVTGARSVGGDSIPVSSLTFSELLVVLNREITKDQLWDFVDYCEIGYKLTAASSDEAVASLVKCARLVMEKSAKGEHDFLKFLFEYFKLRRNAKLCGIIEASFPDVGCVPNELAPADEVNYLQLLKDLLRERNCLHLTANSELLGPDIGPLLEKEVKGVGGIFEVAVELGVDIKVAHNLGRYASMESLLQMTRPGLTVIRFAEALDRTDRKLVVKKIYERIKQGMRQCCSADDAQE